MIKVLLSVTDVAKKSRSDSWLVWLLTKDPASLCLCLLHFVIRIHSQKPQGPFQL